MEIFDSTTVVALKKQLDASALNHRVIANNVANVNTPDFKKNVVKFQEALRQALKKDALRLAVSKPRHIGTPPILTEVKPQVEKVKETTMGYNGNNVDMEEEMVNMAANTLLYQIAGRGLGGKYSSLGYVIRGRW